MKKVLIILLLNFITLSQLWAECSQDISGLYQAKSMAFIVETLVSSSTPREYGLGIDFSMFEFRLQKDQQGNYLFRLEGLSFEGEQILALSSVESKNSFFEWLQGLEKSQFLVQNCQIVSKDGVLLADMDTDGTIYSWYLKNNQKYYSYIYSKAGF